MQFTAFDWIRVRMIMHNIIHEGYLIIVRKEMHKDYVLRNKYVKKKKKKNVSGYIHSWSWMVLLPLRNAAHNASALRIERNKLILTFNCNV